MRWPRTAQTCPNVLAHSSDAVLHIASGETYDFELRADSPGVVPLEVKNQVNKAKLVSSIVAR